MEEVSAKKTRKKKKRSLRDSGTDLSLRILALLIAIISWFVLSITQYPTVTRTVTGVHVDFNMEGSKAQEKGLDALNYKDLTVDVEISGMNYEIGNYNDNDLTATVDLDEVTKEGTYNLNINVKSTHTTDRCTVLSVTPETIEVSFDRITTKTLDIVTEAPLITAEEGYTLKESRVTPSQITVEGPENELENISRAAARITKSQKISDDTVINTGDIVFYDADDNKLDNSKFTIKDSTSFDVEFVVYKKKTVDLNVDITGAPDGFDTSSVPIKLSEDSISVITSNLEDDVSETVNIGSIPLSQINLSRVFNFDIPLASNEINLSGTESVAVTFDSSGYSTKNFTITADRIKVLDRPVGLDTSLETQKLASVTLYGPSDVISSLKDDDVYAMVSLSDISKTGSYTREVTVYLPSYDNVWCYGTNEVQIVISEIKTAEDDDSSAAEEEDE